MLLPILQENSFNQTSHLRLRGMILLRWLPTVLTVSTPEKG